MIMNSNKNSNKSFNVSVKMIPTPSNCYDCPFFYTPRPEDNGTWYEHWDCYLKSLDSYEGIALERPLSCPLS